MKKGVDGKHKLRVLITMKNYLGFIMKWVGAPLEFYLGWPTYEIHAH